MVFFVSFHFRCKHISCHGLPLYKPPTRSSADPELFDFYHKSRTWWRDGEGGYCIWRVWKHSHPVWCQVISAVLLWKERINSLFSCFPSLAVVTVQQMQSDHYPQLSGMINYSICPVRSYNEEVLIKIANYYWQQS